MPIEMVTGEWVASPPIAPLWGAWSVRCSTARKDYDCIECGHLILRGESYWRRYGKMAEASKPWMARLCAYCEQKWRARSAV
jgi:hypothetical protein